MTSLEWLNWRKWGTWQQVQRTPGMKHVHYSDVVMGAMASQITSFAIVYSTVYLGADQRKHQTSASLAFVQWIHRWPVNYHLNHIPRDMDVHLIWNNGGQLKSIWEVKLKWKTQVVNGLVCIVERVSPWVCGRNLPFQQLTWSGLMSISSTIHISHSSVE